MTILIPMRLPSLNEIIAISKNQGRRFSPYAIQKKNIEQSLFSCIRPQLPTGYRIPADSHFVFNWYTKNARRDPDNIATGAKFIFDVLIQLNVLANDSHEYVSSIFHDFYPRAGFDAVGIIILSIPYAPPTAKHIPQTIAEIKNGKLASAMRMKREEKQK